MREICTSGSEGGASQTNGSSLPLSNAGEPVEGGLLHFTLRRTF